MAVADLAFKALTAGLGVATIYLAGTFSVNVYRGLAWHSEQSVGWYGSILLHSCYERMNLGITKETIGPVCISTTGDSHSFFRIPLGLLPVRYTIKRVLVS
ncbi:hypothetical protein EJB05_03777 [Eragrostis curvula]|uniref:Uncharacterized protein n=1 Tax=Eragrostis curvula TaxID=38414 RepID=A0A5J9W8N4_9POAL|nr:hypothetical protein EJB05_03777 [Eragrostis curvula]